MKVSKFQFLTGFLALVVTLAAIYMGQAIWQKHYIAKPLDETLKGIAEIKNTDIKEGKKFNEPLTISVTLDKVGNLQKTYKFINEKIEEAYNNKEYKLVIKDSRNSELEKQYNEINYYVQEAIIDGNFPLLAAKSKELTKANGTDCEIFVDSQNIYIQMSNKNGALYEIVPRPSDRAGGYE